MADKKAEVGKTIEADGDLSRLGVSSFQVQSEAFTWPDGYKFAVQRSGANGPVNPYAGHHAKAALNSNGDPATITPDGPERVGALWVIDTNPATADQFKLTIGGELEPRHPPRAAGGGGAPLRPVWAANVRATSIELAINVKDHPKDSAGVPLVSQTTDIDAITPATETEQTDIGGYLWANDDNDAGSATQVDVDITNNAKENDLEPVRIRVMTNDSGKATKVHLKLAVAGNAKVKVWTTASKSTQGTEKLLLDSAAGTLECDLPDTIGNGMHGVLRHVYLEGVRGGGTATLTGELRDATDAVLVDSKVKATVFEVAKVEWASNPHESGANDEGVVLAANPVAAPAGQTRDGKAVFPDFTSPDPAVDNKVHDIIKVAAYVTPEIPSNGKDWHLPGQVVVFDVDHYSADPTFDGDKPGAANGAGASADMQGHDDAFAPNDNRKGYVGRRGPDEGVAIKFDSYGDTYAFGMDWVLPTTQPHTNKQKLNSPSKKEPTLVWSETWDRAHGGQAGGPSLAFVKITEHTPCNNWRVAAGMGDQLRKAVRISEAARDGTTITTVDKKPVVLTGNGTAIKGDETLTVWRRLFVERDWMDMTAPSVNGNLEQGETQAGTDISRSQDSVLFAYATKATPINSTSTTVRTRGAQVDVADRLKGGVVFIEKYERDGNSAEVPGTRVVIGKYSIIGNTQGAATSIRVQGVVPKLTPSPFVPATPTSPAKNEVVYDAILTDDDAEPATVTGMAAEPNIRPWIEPKKPDNTLFNLPDGLPLACIQAFFGEQMNGNIVDGEVPFRLTSKLVGRAKVKTVVQWIDAAYSGRRNLHSGIDRWSSSILEVYQERDDDGDIVYLPPVRGVTYPFLNNSLDAQHTGCVFVFSENIHDQVSTWPESTAGEGAVQSDWLARRSRTTLHEVGHSLGGQHGDGGLLESGGASPSGTSPIGNGGITGFSGKTCRRFMLLRKEGP